jgi:hypothetical protein
MIYIYSHCEFWQLNTVWYSFESFFKLFPQINRLIVAYLFDIQFFRCLVNIKSILYGLRNKNSVNVCKNFIQRAEKWKDVLAVKSYDTHTKMKGAITLHSARINMQWREASIAKSHTTLSKAVAYTCTYL